MRVRPLTTLLAAASAAALAGVLPAAPASARSSLAVNWDFATSFSSTYSSPTTPPPGASNAGCRPSSTHPDPVILVHGTFENQNDNWQAASPLLANHGYCVFTFNYGGGSPAHPVQVPCLTVLPVVGPIGPVPSF